MRVVIYEPSYNEKHCSVLRNFAAGIPGAIVKKLEEFEPGDGDIGVIFGWYKYAYKPTMAKKPIIDYYRSLGKRRLIIIESGFQLRGQYYQIGWDGFAGHADFVSDGVSPDRWNRMPIRSKPWRDRVPGNVLVIGQLPRDTQVQDVDHIKWCQETVRECRFLFGTKTVVFRPHPKCDGPGIYGIDKRFIEQGKLRESLHKAERVVIWNSTTGVDALLAGVPVVAMDEGAMAWPVASHALDHRLKYPSRRQWLASLGYSQWNRLEMRRGAPWLHLTQ